MSTFTQITYQLIFSTKGRKKVLTKRNRSRLYSYLYGVFEKRKCHVYLINGIEDHIHFIFSLHPNIALAELVKSVKHAGTFVIKNEGLFPDFDGWQDGYSAFTYNSKARENLVQYVRSQEEHHQSETFENELRRLFDENDIAFDEKYLF